MKAASIALDAAMSVSEGFAAIARTTLSQLRANERGVLEAADPEYLHQMRVGLRRLRSAISVFRAVVPEAERAPIAKELRWLSGNLGPARDWDVFVTDTVPAIRRAFDDKPALSALEDSAVAQQRLARRRARRAIRSRRFQRAVLSLASGLAPEHWRAAAAPEALAVLDSPVRAYAQAELERRYQRVRRRGRRLASLDAVQLHELRIAIKKLRYAVDFFASLFDAARVRLLRSRLSRLQDILGALNDAVTIGRLLEAIDPGASTTAGLTQAHGLVLGWAAGRAEGMRENLGRAWRAFRRAETFW